MPLTVVNVSYPLACVGPDAVGGAEQILSLLDRALTRAGHRSIVVAPEGSNVAGTLVATPRCSGQLDELARERAQRVHAITLATVLERTAADIVHLHGMDFDRYVPHTAASIVVTLHVPLDWFSGAALHPARRDVHRVAVSEVQQRQLAASGLSIPVIGNGVDIEACPGVGRRGYVTAIGRICPEKGFDEALEAAHLANADFLLAGKLFRYDAHERYFRTKIAPQLDARRRFIGPAALRRKRRLLSQARCVVIPSRVTETSSLVAMEALACGTPVIVYPAGALTEIVEHGKTGFVVRDARSMANAIRAVDALDPDACRTAARTRFSAARMTAEYLSFYERLANRPRIEASVA